jgi:spoIIIJ-associated protein
MSSIESIGKTTEEAIHLGLLQLGVEQEDVTIEVVEEASHGFLGIGGKPARVRLTLIKAADEEPAQEEKSVEEVSPADATTEEKPAEETFTAEEAADKAKTFLLDVLDKMGLDVMIEKMIKPDKVILHIHGKSLGILIGKHGQTLDALQYLTNLTTNRGQENRHFIMLDVENYRKRREETLKQLAVRLAGRIKNRDDKVVLEPMNGYERKIIHVALQEVAHVRTESEGQDPYRHVVIYYED